ncbi:hypothetical protein E2C01_056928 [Portunus trituberculatus]|uniref:Uncharacterized protein n=1 Tax=Portunus trituberculatus TaxID=210409 RepID=A0A5B7H0G5_PORTR|nr:hypothetical protein [Portunus trituberculatus]
MKLALLREGESGGVSLAKLPDISLVIPPLGALLSRHITDIIATVLFINTPYTTITTTPATGRNNHHQQQQY